MTLKFTTDLLQPMRNNRGKFVQGHIGYRKGQCPSEEKVKQNIETARRRASLFYYNNRTHVLQNVKRYRESSEGKAVIAKWKRTRGKEVCRLERLAFKKRVFRHYSSNLVCQELGCGCDDIRVLTLDHANGGGRKHRRELSIRGSTRFYQWIIKNGYPTGFTILCMNHNFKKRQRLRTNSAFSKRQQAVKLDLLQAYSQNLGVHCVRCGSTDLDVLSLDHKNGDGAKERKSLTLWGNNFYRYLRKHGYPSKDRYQVLCFNCQFIKKAENREFGEEGGMST